MAEEGVELPIVLPISTPGQGRPLWLGAMACLAIIALVGYIGQSGTSLWSEWRMLKQEQHQERESVFVGYLNINPNPNYATSPVDWFHHEGDDSLLWAGWKDGEHRWFRFARCEFDVLGLSRPLGRDSIQAIDYPVYEQDGGPRWVRIPHQAKVVGFEGEGGAIAYPLKVLDKVEVVNDRIGDRPVLIAFMPNSAVVSIFEATVEGRRVTLGHGGYFRKGQPILYDRGTQSLWSESDGSMVAIAGRLKGASLKRIASLDVVTWGDWRDKHPDGRLLIGADRSKSPPVD